MKKDDIRLDNLTVLVTDICNRACPQCVNQGFVNTQKRFMVWDIFIRGIKWAVAHEKDGIILNGGEPTLHPDLNEFAGHAKENGLGTYLFTNYSRPDMVRKMDEAGTLDRITISNYDQPLPCQADFKTPLTLGTIIWNGRFKTKEDFDRFIDAKRDQFDKLFFQTLRTENQWSRDNQFVDWLEEMFDKASEEDRFLHNKKKSIVYRGCSIKHNTQETDSMPRHNLNMDGEIYDTYDWHKDRSEKPLEII